MSEVNTGTANENENENEQQESSESQQTSARTGYDRTLRWEEADPIYADKMNNMIDGIDQAIDTLNTKLDKPQNIGTDGQVLTTNGQGQVSWSSTLSNNIAAIQNTVQTKITQPEQHGDSGNFLMLNNDATQWTALPYAVDRDIKKPDPQHDPSTIISPFVQDISTFYGLAKAAGDETQYDSSNPVGTYTSQAKNAIHNMLDTINFVNNKQLITNYPYEQLLPSGRILCIGDSLTAGAVPDSGSGYVGITTSYPEWLASIGQFKSTIDNISTSGISAGAWVSSTGSGYNEYLKIKQSFNKYNTILLWLGTNNGPTTSPVGDTAEEETVKTTETYYYRKLIEDMITGNNNVKIILGTIFRTSANNNNVELVNQCIREIANKYPNNVLGVAELNDGTLYGADKIYLHNGNSTNVHFNELGYLVVAKKWLEELRRIISEKALIFTDIVVPTYSFNSLQENTEQALMAAYNDESEIKVQFEKGGINNDGTLESTTYRCRTKDYISAKNIIFNIILPTGFKGKVITYNAQKQYVGQGSYQNAPSFIYNSTADYIKVVVQKQNTSENQPTLIEANKVVIKAIKNKPTKVYVATTGNDNNIGTQEYPFATLTKACSIPTVDTVIIGSGEYAENLILSNRNIKIICEKGQATFTHIHNLGIFLLDNCQFEFVNIKAINNITEDDTSGSGFYTRLCTGTFINCIASGNKRHGFVSLGSNIVFDHCLSFGNTSNGFYQAVYSNINSKCTLFNCKGYNNQSSGINAINESLIYVHGGEYYSNNGHGICLQQAASGEILNTYLHNNSTQTNAAGLMLNGDNVQESNYPQVIAMNNILKNNNNGVYSKYYKATLASNIFDGNTNMYNGSNSILTKYNSIEITQ